MITKLIPIILIAFGAFVCMDCYLYSVVVDARGAQFKNWPGSGFYLRWIYRNDPLLVRGATPVIAPPVALIDLLVERTLKSWFKQVGSELPKEDWAIQECRKNVKKSVLQWRGVASDVVSVSISKTEDTDQYVVRLTDSEGREASLWLNKDGTVNSISSY